MTTQSHQIKQPQTLIYWLLALIGDYAIIAFAFWIAYLWSWPAYPFTLLLLGIAQHRLGILGHEGVHGLICQNRKWNYWIAQIGCFWPLLFDFTAYQKFHQQHHKHTDNEHLDPEHQLKADKYHLPKTPMQIYGGFILDCFGYSWKEFFEMTTYFAKRSHPVWATTSFIASLLVAFFTGHMDFLILFMIAKPTTFWAVFRLRIYTEHIEGVQRLHLTVWQRLLFAPHNIWIHWEHHKHPQVPFWQLPSLRDEYQDVPLTEFDSLLIKHKDKKSHSNDGNESGSMATTYPI